jgi:hypothetical protein
LDTGQLCIQEEMSRSDQLYAFFRTSIPLTETEKTLLDKVYFNEDISEEKKVAQILAFTPGLSPVQEKQLNRIVKGMCVTCGNHLAN